MNRLFFIALSVWVSATFLLTTARVQAQQVRVVGVIIDRENNKALSGASIINTRINATTLSDNTGSFITYCDRKDTLYLFCPGYETVRIQLLDSTPRVEYTLELYAKPLSTGLKNPVIVRPEKDYEEIEKIRQELGKVPRELIKPDVDPFASPISYLYEMLSGQAKQREKLKEQMLENNRREVLKEFYRFFNKQGLIDLEERYFDDFTDFNQIDIPFLKYRSDYEITSTIMTAYRKYVRMQGIEK